MSLADQFISHCPVAAPRLSCLHFWRALSLLSLSSGKIFTFGGATNVALRQKMRQSNYGQAKALLFDHIAIPAENIHRIRGEEFAAMEAIRFAEEMIAEIPEKDGVPEFDWILLGMGTDGHTASLFPGQTDYDTTEIAAIAAHPDTRQIRVTKTAHLLANAKRITYLVLGASKSAVIKEIADNAPAAEAYPAAKVSSKAGTTEWYLDSEAAKELA